MFLLILMVLLFVSSTSACSCVIREEKPQDLCCSGYVVHGDVERERLEGNASTYNQERIYTVKVEEIFRGIERIKNISKDHNISYVEIYTQPQSASCGITLQLRESYLIAGSIDNNKMTSYACSDWKSKWQDVPGSYKSFLPYLKTCKCGADAKLYEGRMIFLLAMLITVSHLVTVP